MDRDPTMPAPAKAPGATDSLPTGAAGIDWRYLLPDLARASVLDLTRENEGVSLGLAACCARIVVVEPSAAEAARRETAARQRGLSNLTVVRPDDRGLPPEGDRFDLVVLGRIFDGQNQSGTAAAADRVQLLRRAARCLAPEGRLYVAGRNGAVLARLRWRLAGTSTSGQPSFAEWQRLLGRAGLRFHAVYWVEPSCESPRHWVRLEKRGPVRYYLSGPLYREGLRSRVQRASLQLLSLAGAGRWLARNLMIVAKH